LGIKRLKHVVQRLPSRLRLPQLSPQFLQAYRFARAEFPAGFLDRCELISGPGFFGEPADPLSHGTGFTLAHVIACSSL
jgi:hypothetical protein